MIKKLLLGLILAVVAAIIIIIMIPNEGADIESEILAKRQAIKNYMKDLGNDSAHDRVTPH
ncbi:MAG TPA: hypothetical protein VH481_10600 [Nitrososphaeraceae archaeon]|jgi:hypothetical protein